MKNLFYLILLCIPCIVFAQSNKCASHVDSVIYNPILGGKVIGTGRLQFYTKPFIECEMKGVFVIPGDGLTIYSSTADSKWVEVMYINPKTSNDVMGWVQKNRIKETGSMGSTN
jgi:hypothetical protein